MENIKRNMSLPSEKNIFKIVNMNFNKIKTYRYNRDETRNK